MDCHALDSVLQLNAFPREMLHERDTERGLALDLRFDVGPAPRHQRSVVERHCRLRAYALGHQTRFAKHPFGANDSSYGLASVVRGGAEFYTPQYGHVQVLVGVFTIVNSTALGEFPNRLTRQIGQRILL